MISNLPTLPILQSLIAGNNITSQQQQTLLTAELSTPQTAKAFGISNTEGLEKILPRINLLQTVYADVINLCQSLGFSDSEQTLMTLWRFWLPFTLVLVEQRQKLSRPLIQGILGGQGTGKTTLGAVTRLILGYLGYSSLAISLDDLYKTYRERQLLQSQNPRLIWRGPPGTHDVDLGIQLLNKLRQANPETEILVPRFDKSAYNGAGDRTKPEPVRGNDIILFEGWFVGVRPISPSAFQNPPAPILTPEDRAFAQEINQQLQTYLPLWELLDSLMVLYPTNYRFCQQWRREAEQKMIAGGKAGMSDGEINQFVEYFWKALHPELFIKPLVSNSKLVHLVVEIDVHHRPGNIYQP